MMFLKMTKCAKVSGLLGILVLLLLVGGIYLYHRHTVEPVQERIYMVPEQAERQAALLVPDFQQVPVRSAKHKHISEDPDHGPLEVVHDHESDASQFYLDESDSFVASDLALEEPLPTASAHDAEEARLVDIALQVENLVAVHNEKYPELAQLATISPTEFDELYPTYEGRKELAELSEKARVEFLSEFKSLFSQMPADVREESLAEAHDHFTKYMGQGMADAIMTEVRSLLEQ